MPRIHGYAPVGERCSGVQDGRAGRRTNAVGALLGKEPPTVALFGSSVNSDVFGAWIGQDLPPKLPENSVIVMDNASFHERRDIHEAAASAGHIVEYPPVYSPGLNPIGHKWARAKALRRKQRCSVDELFRDNKL